MPSRRFKKCFTQIVWLLPKGRLVQIIYSAINWNRPQAAPLLIKIFKTLYILHVYPSQIIDQQGIVWYHPMSSVSPLPPKETHPFLPALELYFRCSLFLLFDFSQCCTREESGVIDKVRVWLFPACIPQALVLLPPFSGCYSLFHFLILLI